MTAIPTTTAPPSPIGATKLTAAWSGTVCGHPCGATPSGPTYKVRPLDCARAPARRPRPRTGRSGSSSCCPTSTGAGAGPRQPARTWDLAGWVSALGRDEQEAGTFLVVDGERDRRGSGCRARGGRAGDGPRARPRRCAGGRCRRRGPRRAWLPARRSPRADDVREGHLAGDDLDRAADLARLRAEGARQLVRDATASARIAHEAGVRIAAGTDFGGGGARAGALAGEVEALVSAGLQQWEALAAATWRGGEVLGEADAGVIREGGPAHFILVEGDPLSDPAALWRVRAGPRVQAG